ncbi:SbcC/MukB-like Walker B domain-containing protein, partial [Saccharopolyspora kobensis]
RAEAMRTAQQRLRALRKELTGLEKQVSGKQQDRETAERTIAELEQRESELESGIDALRSHPAYSELQNLRDREQLVESARSSAVSALDTAAKHRAQEHRSAESVVGVLRRLSGDAEAAGQAAQRAAQQLSTAGLDGSLVRRPPVIPVAELRAEQAEVRTSPEPDAVAQEVRRAVEPQLDAEAIAAEFRAVVADSQQLAATARQRSALTLALHQQAVELDAERDKVAELQRLARQAQLTATEAAGRRNQAQQELADAAAVWVERAQKWATEWPSTVEDPAPEPPAAEELAENRTATRGAREQARRWARPQLHEARRQVSAVEQEITELRVDSRTREQELAELRAGHEQTPGRPAWAEAERNPEQGRAFYELVDFQPSLTADERAGLEAALQSSGLLNAWVTADGAVPGLADLLAEPADAGSGATLADLLSPAAVTDCPVPPERVAALLAAVSTDGSAGLSVSTDGSWRAGVLSGAWRKSAAEYVGAGAREAARARRIAELEEDLSRLRAEVGEAERRHHEASEHAAELEQHLEAYPDDGDLLTAHAKLTTAIEAAADSEQKVVQLREQHESADQRWQAAHAELVRSAGEADLPADTRALDAANRAAIDARGGIDALCEAIESRCLPTLADLQEISLHHDVAIADRMEAESQAEQRCAAYAEQASGLAELTSAVGGEAQEISDKVSAFERERADLRKQLPQAREQISSLREAAARLETQLENKQAQLPGREHDASSATETFQQALRIPGLWSAAEVGEELPEELDEAAALLTAAERRGSSEATVLNRLQTLQHSLSGNYDITAADQHGLLTVTVTGEEGPQPVAEAARRVGERLGEQRGYLNERYQSIFADYLIRDLAERLRGQMSIAEDLCKRMNEVLDGARSSQGVHVQLDWQPSAALGDDIKQAIDLVRTPFADRSDDQDALLRRVFTDLIEAERDSTSGGYAEILARALDYRSWFAFTVRVRDTGPDGKPRVRRLRQLSSGETRLISYVTLFAAAAAFYDAVSVSSDGRGPLRLVLLDEAFERLDDPTIARMLGLLVDLDMDWLITWPSGWGVSPKIPKMHIYDVLRPRSGHGIACTHTTWTGTALHRADA